MLITFTFLFFTNNSTHLPVSSNNHLFYYLQISSLRLIFDAAILAAFPQCPAELQAAVISRCANPQFGDFQCNNAMSLSKALKTLPGYTGE